MRIACVIHSLSGGGAERVMAGLASRLSARNHDVTLITLDDGATDRHQVSRSVHRQCLNQMMHSRFVWDRVLNTRRRVRSIRAAITDLSPDVVLSFCDRTNLLVLMAVGNSKFPVVVAERSDPAQQTLGRVGEWLRGHWYPKAAAVVALTETSADHLRARFHVPIHVIPSAIEAPTEGSDRTLAIANKRILGIGRLEHEKGFDRLIDAFEKVARSEPAWTLRILGEGSQRSALEQRVHQRGLSNRVSFAGWVSPIGNELAAATLFALPSRYEGFPSALLEAMAAGVPSVAVDCESGPRAVLTEPVLDQALGGLLVENTVTGLADGIHRLMSNAELRESIGQVGKCVVDRFGWDSMVSRYEQVLQASVYEA
jgi:GalNAc-alpha-(1->4)-GalNAc-alpha-(1->3)-diNAcBac-PP-undecaprenol alpha-1,4-N-acetyl-D-galactosaminyltransferase